MTAALKRFSERIALAVVYFYQPVSAQKINRRANGRA